MKDLKQVELSCIYVDRCFGWFNHFLFM